MSILAGGAGRRPDHTWRLTRPLDTAKGALADGVSSLMVSGIKIVDTANYYMQ
ncbi:hypothetical protein MGALJ_61170 (plasmid) [Mycobacterium gallinarum]|uniref:Uncharacterized protein n=1 Tax=Mycobacterium gallinarum TaxID=39689 RepID=A0A9W4B9D2_9MYCO|nr:hypothetical protein MGALJ_61170 [Mycobacterium gallinarum]